MKQIAQTFNLAPGGTTPTVTIQGPLVLPGGITDYKLSDIVGVFLTYLFPIAGIILFFIIIWGGYDVLMSQGEAEKLEAGRNKLTSGIIGMVLLVLSYLFARLIGYIFGVGGGIF